MTTARVVSQCLVSLTCTAFGILLIDQTNVCCQAWCVLCCFFVEGRIRNCHRLWCKACRDTIGKEIFFVITTGGLKKIVVSKNTMRATYGTMDQHDICTSTDTKTEHHPKWLITRAASGIYNIHTLTHTMIRLLAPRASFGAKLVFKPPDITCHSLSRCQSVSCDLQVMNWWMKWWYWYLYLRVSTICDVDTHRHTPNLNPN